jgi:hypothetical protein
VQPTLVISVFYHDYTRANNYAVASYEEMGLHKIMDKLPSGLYVAGNAAYILTEHLVVSFTGSCRQEDADKDNYNFYLSQLRI